MSIGKITSTIKDIFTDNFIVGATVKVLNGNSIVDEIDTNSAGEFITKDLDFGYYDLLITKPAYEQIRLKTIVAEALVTLIEILMTPLNLYGQTSEGTFQPLSTNNMNALLLATPMEVANRICKSYVATTGLTTLEADNYISIKFSNPTLSNVRMHLGKLSGGSSTNTSIEVIRNGTMSVGTTITVSNLNYGSTTINNSSKIEVSYVNQSSNPNSGGEVQFCMISPPFPLVIDTIGEIIVPSDNSLFLRVKNISSTTANIGLNVTWWEESEQ